MGHHRGKKQHQGQARGQRFQHGLLLRLPLTPELENAFSDPEKAQAIKEKAQNTEIPQEYRVAHRQPNADKDYACNNISHMFVKHHSNSISYACKVPRRRLPGLCARVKNDQSCW